MIEIPADLAGQIARRPCQVTPGTDWCGEHRRHTAPGNGHACPIGILHWMWITHDDDSSVA